MRTLFDVSDTAGGNALRDSWLVVYLRFDWNFSRRLKTEGKTVKKQTKKNQNNKYTWKAAPAVLGFKIKIKIRKQI